jgi:ribonuclease inhibitor
MSMVIYRIDIRDVRTRDELHSKVAEVLPLPEYYGRNLDALFDVLTESSEERVIEFITEPSVEEALGKYYRALTAMCRAAEEDNPNLEVIFLDEE